MPQSTAGTKPRIIPSAPPLGQALAACLALVLIAGCGATRPAGQDQTGAPTAMSLGPVETPTGSSSPGDQRADLAATAASVATADARATEDAADPAGSSPSPDPSARLTAETALDPAANATAAGAADAAEETPAATSIPTHGPDEDRSDDPNTAEASLPRASLDPSGGDYGDGPAPAGARRPAAAPEAATAHRIPDVAHTWQKWNNCGPSSIVMALSAFGLQLDQLDAAAELKPDREDTNVSPGELADYARQRGFRARVVYGGTIEQVKALLRAGVPVLAEQWIGVDGRGEMGHYRVVTAFDDAAGQVSAQDSYYGADRSFGYAEFENMWRPFLGAYVIAWLPEQEPAVRAALGGDWDQASMWQRILAEQEAWVASEPGNAWAHFALGEARSRLGDHVGAVSAFERAREIGLPFRAFWYQFGYYRSLHATGGYDRMIALADETLAPMNGENLEESQYW